MTILLVDYNLRSFQMNIIFIINTRFQLKTINLQVGKHI
jgi:hypothetical protein